MVSPVHVSRRSLIKAMALAPLATPAIIGHAHAADPIGIGISGPMTGQFAQNGQWMKNGVSIAVKQVNDNGGIKGRMIEVRIADDLGPNPTAAANAVTKLATQDEVVPLVGPHYTPGILPNVPLLGKYKIPALTGATGPVVTQQGSPWVFRVRLNDAIGADLLVKYVTEDLQWKKIGLGYVNTAFGQSGIAVVKASLTSHGIEPAIVQTHTDANKDFTSQILGFQQAGVDGIIVWTDDTPAGLIAKQCKTLGAKFGIAGNTAFSQPIFLGLAGEGADGCMAIGEFIKDNPDERVQSWKKLYSAAYPGDEPELYATVYHDAAKLIIAAMERAETISGEAIQQALTGIRDFQGIVTRYGWTDNGDMTHSGIITKVAGGKPEIVKVITS
jgi:branched-chain amino acid transport system substrate-binding protein